MSVTPKLLHYKSPSGRSCIAVSAASLDTSDSRLLLGNEGKRSFIHPVPQRQLRWTVRNDSFGDLEPTSQTF